MDRPVGRHTLRPVESASPPATPSPPPKQWVWYFAIPLISILVADLVSKGLIFSRYRDGQDVSWWCQLAWNPGVAWGLGGAFPGAVLVLTLVLIPVLVAIWWWTYRRESLTANAAFGLILGGAFGNAYDRVMTALVGEAGGYKGVRDFIRIDLNIVGIDYVWPNFNLADSAITVGFALLILSPWILRILGRDRTGIPHAR